MYVVANVYMITHEESDDISSSRQTKEQYKTKIVSNADTERVPIMT